MAIHHIRDLLLIDVSVETAATALLKCIVIKRNKQGRRLFIDVQDDTGATQLVVEQEHVAPGHWEFAVARRAGESIVVSVTRSAKFPSASALVTSIEAVTSPAPLLQRGMRSNGLASPVTQAYVARLQRHLRQSLEEESYIEVVTRLITSSKPAPGLYPLKVLYDGYGAPFYISPSPVPQLVQTLANTPYDKVFAVAKCFTQGYRDPIVSVESTIVTFAARRSTLEQGLRSADSLIRVLLKQAGALPGGSDAVPPELPTRRSRLDDSSSSAVTAPEIQIFAPPEPGLAISESGRLCWPTLREGHDSFREYVVAEGFCVGTATSPAYSVITINVDKLISMLFEHVDLRRIPSLSIDYNAIGA